MPDPAIERRRQPRRHSSFALEELYRLSRQTRAPLEAGKLVQVENVLPENSAARRWRATEFPPDRPGGIL